MTDKLLEKLFILSKESLRKILLRSNVLVGLLVYIFPVSEERTWQ